MLPTGGSMPMLLIVMMAWPKHCSGQCCHLQKSSQGSKARIAKEMNASFFNKKRDKNIKIKNIFRPEKKDAREKSSA